MRDKHRHLFGLLLFFALFSSLNTLFAEDKDDKKLGVGFILGEPTAISAKYFLDSKNAYDLAFYYTTGTTLGVWADRLWHSSTLFQPSTKFERELAVYGGVGLSYRATDKDDRYRRAGSSSFVHIRIPIGIEWQPPEISLGIFVELVPGISIVPETSVIAQGGVGVRYLF